MEIFRELGVAGPIRDLTAGMPEGTPSPGGRRLNGIEFGEIATEERPRQRRLFGMLRRASDDRVSTCSSRCRESDEEFDNVTVRLDRRLSVFPR